MSRIEVPMPQMGESIAEGTVSKWLKAPGDAVERDEPILEISTDKVDAEIPSPAEGTLAEILVAEGETVEVGTVVAHISTGVVADAATPADAPSPPPEADSAPSADAAAGALRSSPDGGAAQAMPESPPAASSEARSAAAVPTDSNGESTEVACTATSEERLRTRSTPVVRRIAQEAGVDISAVPGTGHQGRVTKQDILAYIEHGGAPQAAETPSDAPATSGVAARVGAVAQPAPAVPAPPPTSATPGQPAPPEPSSRTRRAAAEAPSDLWKRFHSEVEHPVFPVREGDQVETMNKVRRLTAEHMVLAKRISSHVHSIIEIDFSTVDRIRRRKKARWAERGARVSYTAFVAWACSRILRDFPSVNGTISGNNIVYRGAVNIGMAVDLNPGLIVPVIHDADDLSLVGTARKIIDLATRAKSRQLSPGEIQGATFTITNPGVLGTMVGMPIIPKGTSAILGTGSIEKRVVVVTDAATGEDAMAIRKRSFFSLGYDHRLVDGADSARFLSALKELLEDFPEDA